MDYANSVAKLSVIVCCVSIQQLALYVHLVTAWSTSIASINAYSLIPAMSPTASFVIVTVPPPAPPATLAITWPIAIWTALSSLAPKLNTIIQIREPVFVELEPTCSIMYALTAIWIIAHPAITEDASAARPDTMLTVASATAVLIIALIAQLVTLALSVTMAMSIKMVYACRLT